MYIYVSVCVSVCVFIFILTPLCLHTEVRFLALGLENHNYWNFDSSFYLTEGPEPVAGLVLFYPRGDSPAGLFQVFGPFQML